MIVANDLPVTSVVGEARHLLNIPSDVEQPFQAFRTGARSRALLATQPGVAHQLAKRQERVLLKLYKGAGTSAGSKQY